MFSMKNKILFGLVFTLLFSCQSTKITSSWKEPNKHLVLNDLNKILVVALFKTETIQHKAEDEMVRYLKGKGVVSYNYFDSYFNKQNEDAIRNKIKKDGFDGAVTMRLVNVEEEKYFNQNENLNYPGFNQTFTDYYLNSMNYSRSSGYYTTAKIFIVETNIYSLKENKIIWTGITESTNPKGIDKMTNEIVKVLYKKMIKEGFIKK
jgi:hypothetical protein